MLELLLNSVTDLEVFPKRSATFPELTFVDTEAPYVSEAPGRGTPDDHGLWVDLAPDVLGTEADERGRSFRFVRWFGDGRVRARLAKLDIPKAFWTDATSETRAAVRLAFRQLDVVERLALAALDPAHTRAPHVGNREFQLRAVKALAAFASATQAQLGASRGATLAMRKDARLNEHLRDLAHDLAKRIDRALTVRGNRKLAEDSARLAALADELNALFDGAPGGPPVDGKLLARLLSTPRSALQIGFELVRGVFPDVTLDDLRREKPLRGSRRTQRSSRSRPSSRRT